MKRRGTADEARSRSRTAVVASAALAAVSLGAYLVGRSASRRTVGRDRDRAGPVDDPLAPSGAVEAELRRAKQAAEAANEAKTRYLVSVSHEIRSPLNAIYGYAQLLERDGGPVSGEAGAVIRRSAEHLTNLVESLLEISRIESGVMTIRSEIVDIRAMLAQVTDMFRVQADAKGLSLDLAIDARLPDLVKTDEKRLRQILVNLVANAVKYTNAGGVTITVAYRSQVADIEVGDTGIGIAAADLDRIFEPFERGGSAEAQLESGIGLGLAITRVLARVMGGDLTVKSAPGAGSVFRLRLMMGSAASVPDRASREGRIEGYCGDPRTILVVDDDPAQTAVMQEFLRPLGFIVHVAGNGVEAVALAGRCPPDIVLLDIQMPGMNGWEAARRLRAAHGGGLRIVMVSAETRIAEDAGGCHDATIAKPVALDALLTLIGGQLGLRWTRGAPVDAVAPQPAPAPLPAEASPFMERLRHSARIGHVRGVADGLRDLRDAVPAAGGLTEVMERQLSDLDLRSILRTLDDAAP